MSAKTQKLSPTQAALFEAMQRGVICHYMPYAGRFNEHAYYFRNDTMKRCTAQVKALLDRELVEKFDQNWRGHKVQAKATGAQK